MQRQETRMPEGVIYEGIGKPTPGPVEWVKQKLTARYTEAGRIQQELNKVEKVMGPLTDAQREEAAEKMHLEGKVKNKVVVTIVTDAVVGTAAVGTAVYLARRPDQKAKLLASMGAGTEVVSNAVVGKMDAALAKLKPVDGAKAKFFPKLLSSMISGAKTVTEKGTKVATGVFERGTASSLKSMSGRVIKAENVARAINLKAGPTTSEAVVKKVNKALDKVGVLENRYARAQVLTEAIKGAPEAVQGFGSAVKMGVDAVVPGKIEANRVFRPVEKAINAIKSTFAKKGEKAYIEAAFAAQEALEKAKATAGTAPEVIQKAEQVLREAVRNRQAAGILAKEAAQKAAAIAAEKAAKAAKEAAKATIKVAVK